MTIKQIVHAIVLSLLVSLLGWTLVNYLVMPISFGHFYIIEFIICALASGFRWIIKYLFGEVTI